MRVNESSRLFAALFDPDRDSFGGFLRDFFEGFELVGFEVSEDERLDFLFAMRDLGVAARFGCGQARAALSRQVCSERPRHLSAERN